MSEVTCSVIDIDGSSNISIEGLQDESIMIDCSGDVDFTALMEVLIDRIDTGSPLEFQLPLAEDDKMKLILSTLQRVLEKYNESIALDTETEEIEDEDDIPF